MPSRDGTPRERRGSAAAEVTRRGSASGELARAQLVAGLPPEHEALRSQHIRTLESLRRLQRENDELKQKLEQAAQAPAAAEAGAASGIRGKSKRMSPEELDSLYVEERRLIDKLTKEVDEGRAAAKAARKSHQAEVAKLAAAQASASAEVKELNARLAQEADAAAKKLAQVREAYGAELHERAADAEAARLELAGLRGRFDETEGRAGCAEADRRRTAAELEQARAVAKGATEQLARAKQLEGELLEHVASAEAEVATLHARLSEAEAVPAPAGSPGALDRMGASLASARAAAERAEREAARAREAEARTRRAAEVAAAEREAVVGAAEAQAESSARALSEARMVAESERRQLASELERVKRQLADALAKQSHGGGDSGRTSFQEFVSLKREIANLRATNAALQRQAGGSAVADPVPRPILGARQPAEPPAGPHSTPHRLAGGAPSRPVGGASGLGRRAVLAQRR